MAKTCRHPRQRSTLAGSSAATAATPAGTPPKTKAEKTWRWWAARLGLAVGVPLVLLGGVEGVLRLAGFGYPTRFCLRTPDGSAYVENRRFLWQFYSRKTNLRPNPFAVAVHKPAGSVRILLVGESAAAGTPEPAYGFGRILECMLRRQFPQRQIEVINAAMPGVNSHILLPVVRDCRCLQPDLVLVYMGNNEATGLYAPGSHSGRFTAHLRLLRWVQWLRALRLGQLFEPVLNRFAPAAAANAEGQSAEFFRQHWLAADDPRRRPIYDHFRDNLADMCAAAHQAGAVVVLMTVPVNVRDCPPFGSLHRDGLSAAQLADWQEHYRAGAQLETAGQYARAITNFEAAAGLDNHYAELRFQLARCRAALGDTNAAALEFAQARDWDAMSFRTDARLNSLIRQAVERQARATTRLVDAEQAFAAADPLPGSRFFRDHVHLNFNGDYQLARTVYPAVCDLLGNKLGPVSTPSTPWLTEEQAAAALALTPVNEVQMEAQIVRTTALPPFTDQLEHAPRQQAAEQRLAERAGKLGWQDFEAAGAIYRAALAQSPNDWRLHFQFARLLMLRPDLPGALDQFQAARQLLPHCAPVRVELAGALTRAGRVAEAIQELQAAEAFNGPLPEILEGLHALQGHP